MRLEAPDQRIVPLIQVIQMIHHLQHPLQRPQKLLKVLNQTLTDHIPNPPQPIQHHPDTTQHTRLQASNPHKTGAKPTAIKIDVAANYIATEHVVGAPYGPKHAEPLLRLTPLAYKLLCQIKILIPIGDAWFDHGSFKPLIEARDRDPIRIACDRRHPACRIGLPILT